MQNSLAILYFDGVCNFCNSSVQFILKRDKKKKILFAPIQSDIGKKNLKHLNIDFENPDSVFLQIDDTFYQKSDAAIQTAQLLGFPYNLAIVYRIIPTCIRDYFYKIIAHNRYKWFGKKVQCMIPSEEERGRFLQ